MEHPTQLEQLIEKIVPKIKTDNRIHAMWIEGSYATGKFNEDSDIDVWLDVDDGTIEACAEAFEQALLGVHEVDIEEKRGMYSENPRLAKYVFHPKGFPDKQTIELDLQEHSRQFVFNRSEHHIRVLFDKDGTIRWDKSDTVGS